MDYLEKYEAEQEARREAITSTAAVGSAALADKDKPRTDMPETDYPVTIIGCIRGVDGWYEAGYDSRTGTIRPLPEHAADGGSMIHAVAALLILGVILRVLADTWSDKQ